MFEEIRRQIRRPVLVASLLLATVTTTGCFGRFRLVRAVYDFNEGIGNKFARSLVTWAMIIVPVYGVAGLIDFVVLNTVEFWTGAPVAQGTQTLPDGTSVAFDRVSPEVLRVRVTERDGRWHEVEMVKVGERAGYVRRADGTIVAQVEETVDGRIVARAAK